MRNGNPTEPPHFARLVVLPEKLSYLRPLLEAFPKALERYHTQKDGDVAWNYHERACTGFLAAAAWLAGGVALEEWRHEKADSKSGRCDLYVRVVDRNISLEAKHCFCRLGTAASTRETVERALAAARADARDLKVPTDTKLAVAFAGAALTEKTRWTSEPHDLIAEWIEDLKSLVEQRSLANRTALLIVHEKISTPRPKAKWQPLGLAVILQQVSRK